MQFRKIKNSENLQVLVYTGYDAKKKRSNIELMGTIHIASDKVEFKPTEGKVLSAEAQGDLDKKLSELRRGLEYQATVENIKNLDKIISDVTKMFRLDMKYDFKSDYIKDFDHAAYFAATKEFERTLRKLGMNRPKPVKKVENVGPLKDLFPEMPPLPIEAKEDAGEKNLFD